MLELEGVDRSGFRSGRVLELEGVVGIFGLGTEGVIINVDAHENTGLTLASAFGGVPLSGLDVGF